MEKRSATKLPKIRLSRISVLHYWKFAFRTLLFLSATALYIINRVYATGELFGGYERRPKLLLAIWLVFFVEMVLRFFPSKFESMGCEKQFRRNYIPVPPEKRRAAPPAWRRNSLLAVVGSWVALNGVIGALHYAGIIDEGILFLISLAYSVCDMICILFFCPFQTWMMQNKCCGSCRIYNWDYAMMFTPLLFVGTLYTWSLFALAAGLLIKWELVYIRHPERFSEATNAALACANCPEKLCHHKRSLQRFLLRQKERFFPHLEPPHRSAPPPEEP